MKYYVIIFFVLIFNSCKNCQYAFNEKTRNNVILNGSVKKTKVITYKNDTTVTNILTTYFNKDKNIIAIVQDSNYQSDSISYIYKKKCLSEEKTFSRVYGLGTIELLKNNLLKKDSILSTNYYLNIKRDYYLLSNREKRFLREHIEFKYNSFGNAELNTIQKKIGYYPEENLIKSKIFKFSKNQSIYINKDSTGKVIGKDEFNFSKKKLLLSRKIIRKDYTRLYRLDYDSIGNLVKTLDLREEKGKGKDERITTLYTYAKFDKQNNWITRYRNGNRKQKLRRIIEYY